MCWYTYRVALAEVDAGLFESCPCWPGKVHVVFLGLDVVHDLWDDCSWCHDYGIVCGILYDIFVIVKSGIVCCVTIK